MLVELTSGTVLTMTDPEQATRPTAEPITAVVADRVSLASVMGPARCHEYGTTWRC
jgi:hypothetical protein